MKLGADMVDDVSVLVIEIDLCAYPGDAEILNTSERARLRRMRSVTKKREYLAGRCLTRRVVGDLTDTEPRDVRIEHGPNGKPDLARTHGLHVNLSHSGERALLAVSRHGPIGVDIEVGRTGRPFARLSRRFFAPSEHEWIQGLAAADVASGFYRLWTLKEAYLKAIGTGLTLSSRTFQVDAESDPPRLIETSPNQLTAEHWTMRVLPTEAGYHAALCTPVSLLRYRKVCLAD